MGWGTPDDGSPAKKWTEGNNLLPTRKEMQADHIIKYPFDHPMMAPKICGVRLIGGVLKPLNHENILKGFNNLRLFSPGQTPIILKAKQSVAGFQLRKGADLTILLTLRENSLPYLQSLIYPAKLGVLPANNIIEGNFKGNIKFGFNKVVLLGHAGVHVEILLKGVVKETRAQFLKSQFLIP